MGRHVIYDTRKDQLNGKAMKIFHHRIDGHRRRSELTGKLISLHCMQSVLR